MLNVILIDDEDTIRDGLKQIIDWNAHGFSVCGEAANGAEGLDKITRLRPDIAIVDIKMPTMDGFQMIKELKQRGIACEYIVLSAYSDFKYAQSAIDMGIFSYILKPVDPDELIEKLGKIRDSVLSKQQTRQYMDMSVSLSRSKIIQNLVLGQPLIYNDDKQYSLYGLDFPWKHYQVGLIELDKKTHDSMELRQMLDDEVEAFLTRHRLGYVFHIDKYTGILIKNTFTKTDTRLLMEMHEGIKQALKTDVTLSLGTPVDSMETIKSSYDTANQLIEKKFIYGYKKIITPGKSVKADGGSLVTELAIDGVIEELYNYIDVENTEKINNTLETLQTYFAATEGDEAIIKIHYSNIYSATVSRLVTSNESVKSLMSIKQEVLTEICKKNSLQELHGYMKYVMLALAEELSRLRPCDPVKKILDYVDRNYSQDLKLESLAVLFHYNSAYLGKLIRSKTGVQFSTYLDNVRISKAKQLLKEGCKVYEAAQKTGFKYIDYFYKKFKKYVGVSPTDYKGTEDYRNE